MTETVAVFSKSSNSATAGAELGEAIRAELRAEPDAVVVFASSRHNYESLLAALVKEARPHCLVGSSSAGEHAGNIRGEEMSCALALRSDSMRFAVGVGHGLSADRRTAARQVVSSFRGARDAAFPYATALVMADALAGHTDELIDELGMSTTTGRYQLVGGGAGDDGAFRRTHVFAGVHAHTDAVVALEMLSMKPIGIGMSHGWSAASPALRVTASRGATLQSLNGIPAMEIFEEHAWETKQKLDAADPFGFFLHNIIGIDVGGAFNLRVPLAVDAQGAISCAADVPVGSTVRIMKATSASVIDAAATATRSALAALGDLKPAAALFFDCVATKLGMREQFDVELDAVRALLGAASLAGCNTYGQIGEVDGQLQGFQNCSAVACVFPE